MARTLEEIKADVMSLPIGERIDLAQDLIRSVDGRPEVESAWLQEIKRRIALSDAGQLEEVDADEVHAELRARYKWDDSATRS